MIKPPSSQNILLSASATEFHSTNSAHEIRAETGQYVRWAAETVPKIATKSSQKALSTSLGNLPSIATTNTTNTTTTKTTNTTNTTNTTTTTSTKPTSGSTPTVASQDSSNENVSEDSDF